MDTIDQTEIGAALDNIAAMNLAAPLSRAQDLSILTIVAAWINGTRYAAADAPLPLGGADPVVVLDPGAQAAAATGGDTPPADPVTDPVVVQPAPPIDPQTGLTVDPATGLPVPVSDDSDPLAGAADDEAAAEADIEAAAAETPAMFFNGTAYVTWDELTPTQQTAILAFAPEQAPGPQS